MGRVGVGLDPRGDTVTEFEYRLDRAPILTVADAEAVAKELLARIRGAVPDPLRDDAERCENCGALVIVLTVKSTKLSEKPRLMELLPKDDDDPHMNKMETHTPQRCRAARRERP